MLVSVDNERSQIAVLDSRELVEHYVARKEDTSIVGNIYLGKVQNVLPGMEAAFINIGVERNAVIYVGEVGFDEELEEAEPKKIEKILKTGQSILAQVTKDPMGSKGARLTTAVSLAGRYVVLVPEGDSLGISRRLSDTERKRLHTIGLRIQPPGFGLIIRTAAEGAGEDELDRDVAQLVQLWYEIQSKSKKSKPPALIHEEPELSIRVVRDLFTRDVQRVIVDDKSTFEKLREYIGGVSPMLSERIEVYRDDKLPLFERFRVTEQIRKALDRKVWLPSGGSIVIEKTEAMTVIDVNTGRYVGKSTLEETVLKTNLEAAEEIAKQLRLRDIGGIIVVDFIDMMIEKNRDELVNAFKNSLGKAKTRTQVFGISEIGLLQMTRKNVSEGLLEAFSETCDKCKGWGVVLTDLD
jgi:ribonuclease E